MTGGFRFLVTGGGTGGHVIPALAVAQQLKKRGHSVLFLGTRRGMEATLVPDAGFEIRWLEIGGLQRVGLVRTLRTLWQLPASVWQARKLILEWKPAALFSMGGYVAGPAMLAAAWECLPVVLMEPNAYPGLTNRRLGRFASKALVSFEETVKHFPPGRAEVTGVPVRDEFFAVPEKRVGKEFTVLITGGSRGARTLNQAFRESWPLFRGSTQSFRFIHQCGREAFEQLSVDFRETGLSGEVTAFVGDMPTVFASADLVVARSGAGSVAELAAAGKPAILVPFPFAADDHQTRNAEAMARAGAAVLVADAKMNGERLFREISDLAGNPERLGDMSRAARTQSKPGAAARAADLLEELATKNSARPGDGN
jgi:UDP-N-acetylglucosamine--N-acetylmuramyl-(pentapeptide) pyrophosphoryl-undecaprenol N-acetylglucosamine transferase